MTERFAKVPIQAIQDSRLSKVQLRVLLAILSFSNNSEGKVWPKRQSLVDLCGYSTSMISTATSQLVKLGWVQKSGKGGFSQSCHYVVTVPDLQTVCESQTVCEPRTSTVRESQTSTVRESRRGNKQTNEQTNEQTKNKERLAPSCDYSAMFDELWKTWPSGYGDKGSKKNALAAYLKLKPDKQTHETMLTALVAQAMDKSARSSAGMFAPSFPHVERWLKNQRWNDEISRINFIGNKPTREQRLDRALDEAFGISDNGAIEGDFQTIDGNGFAQLYHDR